MRLAEAKFTGFKRFTNLRITDIPETSKLVVLAGPNGSGKSSIFDGFRTWHGYRGGPGFGWDETYGAKVGTPQISLSDHVSLICHGEQPTDHQAILKMIYIRSAFRHDPDFQVSTFGRLASPLESVKVTRLIDNDASVADNYQRLVMQTIDGIYDADIPDTVTKGEIRDRLIGRVQEAMKNVFPDLVLSGVGGIASGAATAGSFYFEKGEAKGFLYKNLSAGEKSAFDLILDFIIKRDFYDDTIWCIDEPETHLSTRVQGTLLRTLLGLLPDTCQLFLASHSIGFMRAAWEMNHEQPGSVSFLDLQGADFDSSVTLRPVAATREFWSRTLDVALGDLAALVAPEEVVLCEGRPKGGAQDNRAAFDAECYRRIFAREYPNVDFISVGNSEDAAKDRLEVGKTIQAISTGTKVRRLIDRDMRTQEEVAMLSSEGVRVLSRRHIEAFLLDEEVIAALCERVGRADLTPSAYLILHEEMEASIARGNDPDDWKSPSGSIYTKLRKLLNLTSAGSTWSAFARDTLSPLLSAQMSTYQSLKQDVFG